MKKSSFVDYVVMWKDPDITDGGLLAAVEEAENQASRDLSGWRPMEVRSWPPACAPLVSVRCPRHGGERTTPTVAGVWQTPYGPLYRAALVHSHGDRPQMEDPVHMRHPETGNVSKVTRTAFERHHSKRGWQLSDREPTNRRFRPLPATVVRDLFDYQPAASIHPPLRCQCPHHGEGVVDRMELARTIDRARRGSQMQCFAVSFGYTA